MPVTLTATAGASDANSFVTVEEADAYLATRLNSSAWTGTEPKKIALIEATREVSRLVWVGSRTNGTQALSWPRTDVTNLDDPDGSEFEDDEIPQFIQDMTCEIALAFLKAGTTDLVAPDSREGVIRKKTDVLETEWASGAKPSTLEKVPRALELAEPYLEAGGLEVVRV